VRVQQGRVQRFERRGFSGSTVQMKRVRRFERVREGPI
jgi:hypothetical protein